MRIKKNLNRLDQFLRIGLGIGCLYLGFVENDFVKSEVLALLLGVFGIINIVFALIGSCPVYLLAGINTSENQQNEKSSLQTRNKLLTSFVAVAIAIVTIFGFVSYKIAKEFSVAEEVRLWERFNRQKAVSIIGTEIIGGFTENKVNHFILLDEALNPLDSVPYFLTLAQSDLLITKIKQLIDVKQAGVETVDGKPFIWAITPVPKSENQLLVVHQMTHHQIATGELAKKFIIAALLLQWFAVWGALILSSIVGKRINKQSDLIVHQALHDRLTGLPNRKNLLDRLSELFSKKERADMSAVLFIFDLNRFKDINNLLGQHSGDDLLKMLATRFSGSLNESDTLARLDGDEFAILSFNTDELKIAAYIKYIFSILDAPFLINGMEIQCEISLGVAPCSPDIKEPMDFIQRAEIAMFCSKDRSIDYLMYSPEMDDKNTHDLTVITELRNAITNNELCLYYQPKVNMLTGKVESLEALIRWQHPDRGLQFPDTFIPQAEQTGLIKPLTLWTIREALRQSQSWRDENINLPIAVNFSQRLLSHDYLVKNIADLLEEYAVLPENLELEITESAVMSEAGGALEMIAALDALGIPLSIDDFGTGYTSMSHIRDLPIKTIKIDKSFVLNLADNVQDEIIVNAIINFVHDIGHKVVAEGIENVESWNKLEKMGCNIGQGYFMARPIPADKVREWLQKSKWS